MESPLELLDLRRKAWFLMNFNPALVVVWLLDRWASAAGVGTRLETTAQSAVRGAIKTRRTITATIARHATRCDQILPVCLAPSHTVPLELHRGTFKTTEELGAAKNAPWESFKTKQGNQIARTAALESFKTTRGARVARHA